MITKSSVNLCTMLSKTAFLSKTEVPASFPHEGV